ncbi:hypothetical protein QUF79_14580 [Fictibacillus enclensis]|uniref:HNH endonuclease n=1 Tax=Fictibacillus enclensis TaxID=1017270 RepID=UPI0025A0BF24|nr:hypothetical protein [Fictibacillus enclensis]MDM5199244.1 hypothetical protein [Fictibacillus enclensis]
MLRSCSYCLGIHDHKFDCGKKPKRKDKGAEQDKFRNTYKWQKKRKQINERDNYLCQICIRDRYDTVTKYNYKDTSIHHIYSLLEDYDKRLDDVNLVCLCREHHEMAEDGKLSKMELLEIVREQEKKWAEL